MSDPGRTFAQDHLLKRVWGPRDMDGHVLEVTIGRLRRKLGDAGAGDVIETVRGFGYRLIDTVAASASGQPASVVTPST